MTEHIEPDDDETAVRTALLRLGVRPAGHAPDDEAEQQPATVAVPPKPDYEPTAKVPAPRRASAPRMPGWWEERKPQLALVGDEPAATGHDDEEKPAPGEPDDADDQEEGEEPTEQAERRRRPRLQKVLKRSRADDDGDPDDLGEEDEEEPGDDDEDAGEGQPAKRARRWRPSGGGSSRPPFATPVFTPATGQAKERKSLVQAAREMSPEAKFLIYHGTGLGAGFFFGIPQYAHDVIRSIADSPLALRDNPDAYFWGVGAVLLLALDRATRRWSLVVHWAARGLTTSAVIGAALHGNPIPH
ncbi:hypothetical protein ABZ464_23605 [Streptomyces sp. NPDC005820]|uniref:hypothetical protein n=1 Tax=Streptomyces sp. NPDC005820 TaxID=3157069 RepID=UPI0033D3A42F